MRNPVEGILYGLGHEALARGVERMRAGPVEADVLAEAILAATPNPGRPVRTFRWLPPVMLRQDRE